MNLARHIRRIAAAAAFTVLAASAAQAQSGAPWRHGIIEAKSDAGILMMVTRGFAEKQGLKLEIVQFKSDAIGLKALLAGEIESYDGALTGTVVAASLGVDVKLLGCHWPGLPHGIFVHDTIKTVEDLRGKTIATSTPSPHPAVLPPPLPPRHNIDPAQVKLANMGGDADRYRALVARVVDATVVSSEYVPIAAKNNIHQLVSAREIVPDYMRLCMFSSRRPLAARHEDAVRFLAAEMSGLRYALGHRDEAIRLTQELVGMKPDDPRPGYIFDDAVRTGGVDPNISIPMDKVAWMRELLVKDGRLTRPFDLATMMAPEIRAEALQRVGK